MTNEVKAQPKKTLAQIAAEQEAAARKHNERVQSRWTGINCDPPPPPPQSAWR